MLLRQLSAGFLLCYFSCLTTAEPASKRLPSELERYFKRPLRSIKLQSAQQQFFAQLPSGEAVTLQPRQKRIDDFKWVKKGQYQLGYTDQFSMTALVISTKQYTHDTKSDIAPYDFVVGWQEMSDPKIISQINIYQNNRFYYWYVNQFPIPREAIEQHSTNLHLIPSDATIRQQLANVEQGDIIRISGFLTDVKDESEFIWVTSRSREDSGDGACEIVLIEKIEVVKHLSPSS
jgi:hypothetical protein